MGVGSALTTGPLPALGPAGQLAVLPLLPTGVTLGGALEGAVGLTGVPLLLASGVALQPLAPALLTRTEVGADLDVGWAEMAVDDNPRARLQPPQLLHRDQRPVAGGLGGRHPAAGVGAVVGFGDRLITDQLGAEL